MIERAHRTIKTAIIARKQAWLDALPIVLLGIRGLPNESGFSPFTALTGNQFLMPKPVISTSPSTQLNHEEIKNIAQEMSKLDFKQLSEGRLHSVPKQHIPSALKTCTHVWLRVDRVRRALEAPYSGPYLIKERNYKHFVIELSNGTEQTVSIERLKPATLAASSSDQPPHCGEDSSSDDTSLAAPSSRNDDVSPNETLITEPSNKKSKPLNTRSGRTVKFNNNNDYFYF